MPYTDIRTIAFEFSADDSLSHEVAVLPFPESWKEPLLDLCRRKTGKDKPSIPIRSLNASLMALLPDVVSIASGAGYFRNVDWIMADRAIDAQVVHLIVANWVHAQFNEIDSEIRHAALDQLNVSDLKWGTRRVNLNDWSTNQNGTAKPNDGIVFSAIPDFVARKFTHSKNAVSLGGLRMGFRRVPRESGARIISWPPISMDAGRRKWYFSLYLDFTVQNVAFHPTPLLHCHAGIMRWISKPGASLFAKGRATTAFILTNQSWISGSEVPIGFQTASAKRKRVDGNWLPNWDDVLPQILDSLSLSNRFPDPQTVLEDPESYLQGDNGVTLAFVHRNELDQKHYAGTGLSPFDRGQVDQLVTNLLSPSFVPVDRPQRCQVPRVSSRNHSLESVEAELWVHWQTKEWKDAITAQIRNVFGKNHNVSIRTRKQCGKFGTLFKPVSGGWKESLGACSGRISDAFDTSDTHSNTGALIEIDTDLIGRSENPKTAIRNGFARKGIVTQFVGMPDDLLEHRASQGILDLARQLGCCDQAVFPVGLTKNESLHTIGFWLIDQRMDFQSHTKACHMPVAVHIDQQTRQPMVRLAGSTNWLKYTEALVQISRGEFKELRNERAVNFIRDTLSDFRGEDVLALAEAHNLRRHWRWLQNGNVSCDALQFTDGASIARKDWPGLRVARLRTSEGRETPAFYAGDQKTPGLSSGLFQFSDRVYFSAAATPPTNQQNRKQSKFLHWRNRDSEERPPRPSQVASNPNLIEITCAFLQPEDDAPTWANLVHAMRRLSVQYAADTQMPLPIHLAKTAREYIPPIMSLPAIANT